MRGRQFLQSSSAIERREKLAVLVFTPRLAGLGRHLRLAPVETLDALQRRRGLVERPHCQGPLIRALRRKHLAGFRIDTVGERTNDCECLCCIHRQISFRLVESLEGDPLAEPLFAPALGRAGGGETFRNEKTRLSARSACYPPTVPLRRRMRGLGRG